MIHTVKDIGIINKAEVDVFLELSCFFNDPADFGNLISGSSAFSKSSLNIWKFMVHVLLKPGLENFEHYFTSVWDACNCEVVWAFFGIGMKTDLLQSCGHCWVSKLNFTGASLLAQTVKNLPAMQETHVRSLGCPWKREWLPILVFLPGEFHGWRSLADYSPWGHKESDTTEQLYWQSIHFFHVKQCFNKH